MLSTMSRRRSGFPFGSIMPYAIDPLGRPLFLISSMAMHTQNLSADPRASLLIAEESAGGDPLGRARVTLIGEVARLEKPEAESVRGVYLERHANARHWIDYEDFAFYRMDVIDLYYVGGFGVMGWVPAEEYSSAEPDPLAGFAGEILSHLNTDHSDALLLLARRLADADAERAVITAIDRLGFHLRLSTSERVWGIRLGFPQPVLTREQARSTFVEMIRQARQS
jgi:putative heme iron utilization protein